MADGKGMYSSGQKAEDKRLPYKYCKLVNLKLVSFVYLTGMGSIDWINLVLHINNKTLTDA